MIGGNIRLTSPSLEVTEAKEAKEAKEATKTPTEGVRVRKAVVCSQRLRYDRVGRGGFDRQEVVECDFPDSLLLSCWIEVKFDLQYVHDT